MKKLLLLLLLVTSLPIMSQTYNVNATYLMMSDGVNERERNVDIDILLDLTNNRLTIYSNDTQIIDYKLTKYYNYNNYTIFEATATDTTYRRIGLKMSFSKIANSVIITINYSDLAYSYICKIMPS